MLTSFLEEELQRAADIEAALPFGDSLRLEVPRDIFVALLQASVGAFDLDEDQRKKLIAWVESAIDSCELDALDHDTLRYLLGLRRAFGRGGRPPKQYGRPDL